MTTPEDVAARLTALAEKATPGPWTYRPMQYDDWGMVRADDMAFVAGAHAGRHVSDAELDEHRRNKTDPFEHNGLFISACREGVPALCEALTDQRATIAAQDEAGRLANITTARAVERAEKAEAVVERLERALKRIKNMNTDTFEAMGPLMSCVEIARAALSATREEPNG